MIKNICLLWIFTASIAAAMEGQADYYDYTYTQKDYSETLLEREDGFLDRMSRRIDLSIRPVTNQGGYHEYSYTQKDYSDVLLGGDEFDRRNRMSRGLVLQEEKQITDQADYYDYLYTQRDYSHVLLRGER